MSKLFPWSFTSWNDYGTCPRRFYEVRIAKNFREPESEHLIWGNSVHKAMELRVRDSTPLPNNMQKFEPVARSIEAAPGEVFTEIELAVKVDLTPCGFWDRSGWVRGKGDVVIKNGDKAVALDYKTGKVKPNRPQLELMTALIFCKYPDVEVVFSGFVWLGQNAPPTRDKFERKDMMKLFDQFTPRLEEMIWSEQNDTWPAKPSGLCRAHCPVTTCPNNGKSGYASRN